MRRAYVVSYDIADPKRLRKVFRLMRGFGDHIQLSVFRCDLTRKERVELEAELADIIHNDQDQVLVIDLGKADTRARKAIAALGKPYTHPERHAIVV